MPTILTCWRTAKFVGRIFNANAGPVGSPWMWTLIFPQRRPHAHTRLCRKLGGRDGGVWQELASIAIENALYVLAVPFETTRCIPWTAMLAT